MTLIVVNEIELMATFAARHQAAAICNLNEIVLTIRSGTGSLCQALLRHLVFSHVSATIIIRGERPLEH